MEMFKEEIKKKNLLQYLDPDIKYRFGKHLPDNAFSLFSEKSNFL